jgi:hypothetical protein
LQTWVEKRLDELAQFKVRLQFRRAHQPDKPTFKYASPNEYGFNCTDSEVKKKNSSTKRLVSFSARIGDA